MTQNPLKILFLTRYDRKGASSRYRYMQYLAAFESAGLKCTVSPLFNDEYLTNRYSLGKGSLMDYVKALHRRLTCLLTACRYDLLVIEKEVLIYFPAWIERLIAAVNIPYVVDYDDAIFHQYDTNTNWWIRKLFGEKIAVVMKKASLVIAGNNYLANYAIRSGARKVEILPTVIDLDQYPKPLPIANDLFSIGWVGSPASSQYLSVIGSALAEACADNRSELLLLGAGTVSLPDVPTHVIQWSEKTEVANISKFDVGIMPLTDDPWSRGKCGFKLIQYMACGIPVVASPVGVNCEIVEHGVNGFLAETQEEWINALTLLRDNVELRHQMGKAGRLKVEESYCIQKLADRYVELLRGAASV